MISAGRDGDARPTGGLKIKAQLRTDDESLLRFSRDMSGYSVRSKAVVFPADEEDDAGEDVTDGLEF